MCMTRCAIWPRCNDFMTAFHAEPREARAISKQSDGDRADADRDLPLRKAGQANHDYDHAEY
jgi:hypothetical protein